MSKPHIVNEWSVWVEMCAEFGENPHEVGDLSRDLGGGNSEDWEYIGEYPDEEEEDD